ncbi:hypothetical protein [Pseudomonas sp. B22129]|uniref:hypothetical protein n=1 Tax=Pseudomonas sp. B22129 TaxID=3235111 RepID=UPI0037840ADA
MDRTNRDIIDSFVSKQTTDYTPERLLSGKFDGEVSGYPGLLARPAAKSQEVTFRFPVWDNASTNSAEPDTVTFQLREYRPVSSFKDAAEEDLFFETSGRSYSVPASNVTTSFEMRIPEAYLPNGLWLYRCKVFVADSGAENRSIAAMVLIDEKPPFDDSGLPPPAPTLPAGTPPLSLAYIQSLPNQTLNLDVAYTAADGLSPGDSFSVFVGTSGNPVVFPGGVTKLPLDPAQPTQIQVPLSALTAITNGNYDISYIAYDVVGNPSLQSYRLPLPYTGAAPVPTGFQPLVVLLAEADGMIHQADVDTNNGLRVRLPPYTNPVRPSDSITVTLNSIHASIPLTVPVGATGFPDFQFTSANMLTLYGGGPGNVPVTATYTVNSGGTNYPTPPLSTPFNLNLTRVGPDLITDLRPVVVEAVRPGNTFGPADHLEVDDINRDGRFRIPLWTTAVLPANQLPFRLTVDYGGRLYSTDVTSIPANGEVIIPLPFADILAIGGPTVPVSYTVSRPNNPNTATTPTHLVTVESAIMRMDRPVVQNTTEPNKIANCDSMRPVNTGTLQVFIPGSIYLVPGGDFTVLYTGFQNNTTTAPSVIALTVNLKVPPGNASTLGFMVDLGTALELYNPVNATRAFLSAGSATVSTSVQFQGQTVSSLNETIRVRGHRPGNGRSYFCNGPEIPA